MTKLLFTAISLLSAGSFAQAFTRGPDLANEDSWIYGQYRATCKPILANESEEPSVSYLRVTAFAGAPEAGFTIVAGNAQGAPGATTRISRQNSGILVIEHAPAPAGVTLFPDTERYGARHLGIKLTSFDGKRDQMIGRDIVFEAATAGGPATTFSDVTLTVKNKSLIGGKPVPYAAAGRRCELEKMY